MSKGLLIVISGPSGAGKGTICKELLSKNEDIFISVSATTRNPREGEKDGVNYFFISKDKFERMIGNEEFLEYAEVFDNYYGTPKSFVYEMLESGKNVLLEIDIQGALSVKKMYPDGVFIFILPPSMKELKDRIINRGTENENAIEKRFNTAFEEIKFVNEYDYAVVNDIISESVSTVESIINSEKYRVRRMSNIISLIKEEN